MREGDGKPGKESLIGHSSFSPTYPTLNLLPTYLVPDALVELLSLLAPAVGLLSCTTTNNQASWGRCKCKDSLPSEQLVSLSCLVILLYIFQTDQCKPFEIPISFG